MLTWDLKHQVPVPRRVSMVLVDKGTYLSLIGLDLTLIIRVHSSRSVRVLTVYTQVRYPCGAVSFPTVVGSTRHLGGLARAKQAPRKAWSPTLSLPQGEDTTFALTFHRSEQGQ